MSKNNHMKKDEEEIKKIRNEIVQEE